MAASKPDPIVSDRYQLTAEVGHGGFASVYSAIDRVTGEQVALKFLKRAEDRRRFEVEARALMALDHPNCLRVLGQGHDDGRAYIVTEFIRGVTLRAWLADTRSLEDRVFVALQLAHALQHAHSRGVLHRDFKLENVLVTYDSGWVARVVDFGLAKLVGVHQPDITTTGEVIGTPGGRSLTPGPQILSKLHGLERRQIRAYVPQSYAPDEKHPLIIVMHEGNQTPDSVMAELDVASLAEQHGAVAVAPQGEVFLKGSWKTNVEAIVADAQTLADETSCIDRDRVVLLGHGVGSGAALRAACVRPYAAVVITNFWLEPDERPPCPEEPPSPTLLIMPDITQRRPGCGTAIKRPVDDHVSLWTQTHHCAGAEARRELAHGECTDWACDVPLTICEVAGGLHWARGYGNRCDGASPFDYHRELSRFLGPLLVR